MQRISPAHSVYEGTFWLVEHAYPAGLLGWMVIVLKRHLAALHELSDAEFQELGRIQPALVAELSETLHSEKEYVACFAEGEHFRHVHFHVVAVPKDLPPTMRGARSFQLLQINEDEAVKPQDVRALCDSLRPRLAERLGSPA
jgi:diadenosine tetraphosphate (Ap4A) HIT family hydrolase